MEREELFSLVFFVFVFLASTVPAGSTIFRGAPWEISLREVGACSELGWGRSKRLNSEGRLGELCAGAQASLKDLTGEEHDTSDRSHLLEEIGFKGAIAALKGAPPMLPKRSLTLS